MSLDANPVSLGDATKKSQYDLLHTGLTELYGGLYGTAYTKTLTNESYTILDDDGFQWFILSGTLTANRTATLPTLAANLGRVIRFIDISIHGAYRWIIDGEGSETINGFTTIESMYDGEWNYSIYGQAAEWKKIGGTSFYTVPEDKRTTIIPTFSTFGSTWNDCTPGTPAGTRSIRAQVLMKMVGDSTTDAILTRFRKNGSSQTDSPFVVERRIGYLNLAAEIQEFTDFEVELDTAGVFEYRDLGRSGGGAATGSIVASLIGGSY